MCRRTSRQWYVETKFGKFAITKDGDGGLLFSDKAFGAKPLLFSNVKDARKLADKIDGTVRFYTPKTYSVKDNFPY